MKQSQFIHEDEQNPGRLSCRADVSGEDAKEAAVQHKLGLQTLSSSAPVEISDSVAWP